MKNHDYVTPQQRLRQEESRYATYGVALALAFVLTAYLVVQRVQDEAEARAEVQFAQQLGLILHRVTLSCGI